jgi:hypothetical protein
MGLRVGYMSMKKMKVMGRLYVVKSLIEVVRRLVLGLESVVPQSAYHDV